MKSRINKFIISAVLLLAAHPMWAAEADHFVFKALSQKTFLIVAGLVVLAAFISLYNMMIQYFDRRAEEMLRERGMESAYTPVADEKSWWTKLYERATEYVPQEKEQDILLDHNYDGIEELDNNLPPWWLWMFYISIAFGIFYVIFYHFSPFKMSNVQQYDIEMAEAAIQVKEYKKLKGDMVDEENLEALTEEADLALGQGIFINSCAACHRPDGGGSIGPNLTDDYWLHGGDISHVFKTIKYGVPEKGMISWKSQLRPTEMHQVASYILTLRGTNPENPKEAQGELMVYQDEE